MKRSKSKTLFILLTFELGLSGFTSTFQDARRIGGLAWWILIVFIVLLLAVVAFWIWSKSRSQTAEPVDRTEEEEPDNKE